MTTSLLLKMLVGQSNVNFLLSVFAFRRISIRVNVFCLVFLDLRCIYFAFIYLWQLPLSWKLIQVYSNEMIKRKVISGCIWYSKQKRMRLSFAVSDGIICFYVRFCDNSLLVLKMRFQFSSFASKKAQRYSGEKRY